jgi:SUMO ligase MMS21 Smc5/6 complex component
MLINAPVINKKTLKPAEANVKEVIEELYRLYVNLPKTSFVSKKIAFNIIEQLKSNKTTFQQLLSLLLYLKRNLKDKQNIATVSFIFNKFQELYKANLKEI